MAKILRPLNTSTNNGGAMKKRLPNAYIRGSKVYIDYTLTPAQAKELRAKGIPAEAKRYRLATGKAATAINLKWVNENPLKVIENLLSSEARNDYVLANYGLKSLEAGSVSRKEKTIKDYLGAFNNYILPTFGKMELDEITASDLGLWQKKLLDTGLSASRVRNIRATFQTIMADALRDGIISKNPFDGVKVPRIPKKEVRVYTLEEVKLLIDEAEGWFKNMLTLLFFTGMRTGEMMALEWQDINFKSKKIHISKSMSHGKLGAPKTHETRAIDMLSPVEEALRDQYRLTGLKYSNVFLAPKTNAGWRESKSITDKYWKPLVKRCGLEYIDFYDTRHTFASIMLSYGENTKWVSTMLGHTSIATTERYYSKFINDSKIQRAVFLSNYGFGTQVGTNLAQNQNFKTLKRIG